MKISLLALSFLLLIPNFFRKSLFDDPVYNHTELFDSSLIYLNSVDKLIMYADSSANITNKDGRLPYAFVVGHLLRDRFYHGFSHYLLSQNWLAVLTDKLLKNNLSCPVLPDDILKFPFGGCSQQVIVFAEVMKRKNIPYRTLGFPHHLAVEFFFNNDWYFFDPNMEPILSPQQRNIENWKHNGDSIKYHYPFQHKYMNWVFGNNKKAIVSSVNTKIATKAQLFQSITKFLSPLLWTLPILLGLIQKFLIARSVRKRSTWFIKSFKRNLQAV